MPADMPRICACGSTRNVGVDHVDGYEEHTEPENLIYLCKVCNTAKGFAFRRAGIGRRINQNNPGGKKAKGARTMGQWAIAHLSLQGKSDAMTPAAASEMIYATPMSRRGQFAREIWRRRRERYGSSGLPESKQAVPF
jgi:hypothetical protein